MSARSCRASLWKCLSRRCSRKGLGANPAPSSAPSRAISRPSAGSTRSICWARPLSCRGSGVGAAAARSSFSIRRSTRSSKSGEALLSEGGEAPRDLLTLLMSAKDPEDGRGIADADVRANIVTFINAGHETTANALTWALFLLSQSPEWRERAEADADQAFDADGTVALERCEILRAVFEEALRLYPPAAMLARQAIADDELAGITHPCGHRGYGLALCLAPAKGSLGSIPTPSILRDSLAKGAIGSTVSPTFRSARGRACASAWPSRCRRGSFCSRIFCALSASSWSKGHVVMPLQRVTLRPREGMKMHVKKRDRAWKVPQRKNFLCESALTEISQGPICASPNDDGRF